jgi:hypothetical protein
MKLACIAIGLLIQSCVGCLAREPELSDFKPFTSKEGRFTVEFPGDPTATEQQVDSLIGKMTVHIFLLRIGNEYEYSTDYNDLPGTVTKAQMKAFNLEGAFKGARDGIIRATKSKVTKETKIKLDKWPGREWELEGTGDGNEDFRWRYYVVNTRQYQICIGWLKGYEPPKAIADKFFDSLKISAE